MVQKELRFKLVGAINRYDMSAVCRLIQEGTELNCVIPYNKTPLLLAIQKNSYDIVQVLVRAGAEVNMGEPDLSKERPLHLAVALANCNILSFLLKQGANVNCRNDSGCTPLMKASYAGDLKKVKLLCSYGADINAKDKAGRTALHWAAERQCGSVLRCLVENGADISAVNKSGWTALYHNIINGHVDTIKLLLELGISVSSSSMCDQSPLLLACRRINLLDLNFVMSAFLEVDIGGGNIPRSSVPQLCTKSDIFVDFEILQLLLNAGADLDYTRHERFIQNQIIESCKHEDSQAVWNYVIDSSCTYNFHQKLQRWMEEDRTLQKFCRSAIRSHLVHKMHCRDIAQCVSRLPIPGALKHFLNMSDFVEKHPKFRPLFIGLDEVSSKS